MNLDKIALVLEGGGVRGFFSAGVFEAFMLKNLTFPYITAVSAGACSVLSYMSHQPLRTRKIIQKYVADSRCFSLHNWLKEGTPLGFDFIFDDLPNKLMPFDYEAFKQYPGILQVGTTDIRSGKSIWFGKEAATKFAFQPVRASSSLPFISHIVNIGSHPLLDGAILNPIPYQKARRAGYKKFVFVLTRNAGYRKKSSIPQIILKTWYKDYPKLWELMEQRPQKYNELLAEVEALEAAGQAVIIRPETPIEMNRLDLNENRLLDLHDHGIGCGLEAYAKIMDLYHSDLV